MRRRMPIPSEAAYAIAIVVLAFAVAMLTAADFGLSMVVAPAYILSQKLGGLSFGQCEYLLQAGVFVVLCLLMRQVRPAYFCAFVTCLLYGAVLDLWRLAIPAFNPAITPPGSLSLPVRIVFFVIGMQLSAFAVALFFKTYLYPQVYDFFVKCISAHYGIDRTKFKRAYDAGSLAVACAMSLLLFQRLVGIGIGTVLMTACNGLLIGFYDRWMERVFVFPPLLKRLAPHFRLEAGSAAHVR